MRTVRLWREILSSRRAWVVGVLLRQALVHDLADGGIGCDDTDGPLHCDPWRASVCRLVAFELGGRRARALFAPVYALARCIILGIALKKLP